MTKAMVTGESGFIGSVLLKQLLDQGFEVGLFDLAGQIARNPPPRKTED
jgi:nucleoside-diphosphate-sugar epimerase